MVISFTTPVIQHQTLLVVAVLVAAAVLASIVLEVLLRHYNKKQLLQFGDKAVKLSKAWVAISLSVLSAAFTWLGYLLVLAQSNTDYLSSLPFVGKHITGVVGTGYILYNLRLNKTYQHVANILTRWSSKKKLVTLPVATPVLPLESQTTQVVTSESPFEA